MILFSHLLSGANLEESDENKSFLQRQKGQRACCPSLGTAFHWRNQVFMGFCSLWHSNKGRKLGFYNLLPVRCCCGLIWAKAILSKANFYTVANHCVSVSLWHPVELNAHLKHLTPLALRLPPIMVGKRKKAFFFCKSQNIKATAGRLHGRYASHCSLLLFYRAKRNTLTLEAEKDPFAPAV